MPLEIISCVPGPIEPSFIPDFYYHYGQDLQNSTFEEFVHHNVTPTWGCTFDWLYYAAIINPDSMFSNDTHYDIRLDNRNYSDIISFQEDYNRTFRYNELERLHRKMTKERELYIRVCGSIVTATEEVCTEFRVYMDPNATISLKTEVAENDECNREWQPPFGFPLHAIVIGDDSEPAENTSIYIPNELTVDKSGKSWSIYCSA